MCVLDGHPSPRFGTPLKCGSRGIVSGLGTDTGVILLLSLPWRAVNGVGIDLIICSHFRTCFQMLFSHLTSLKLLL